MTLICSSVFIVNFENIFHIVDFKQENTEWEMCRWVYMNASSTLIFYTLHIEKITWK